MDNHTRVATLALIVRNGNLLLGEKITGEIGRGTLNGPGGKVEDGESIAEAACREILEETGLFVQQHSLEKVAVLNCYVQLPSPHVFQVVHVFLVTEFTGEPIQTESMIPSWHALPAIPYDRMLEADRHWLPKALKGGSFVVDIVYERKAHNLQEIRLFDCT